MRLSPHIVLETIVPAHAREVRRLERLHVEPTGARADGNRVIPMRLLAARYIGFQQARRLSRTAARRKLRRRLAHMARLGKQGGARVKAKRQARERLAEQVKLDQAAGLEWRRKSEPVYLEACRRRG